MGKAVKLTLDMLKVRNSEGELISVGSGYWGAVYDEYLKNAGNRNIVWKRRQMGMTTFALARGFLKVAAGKMCIVMAQRPNMVPYLWETMIGFIDNLSSDMPIAWWNSTQSTFGTHPRSDGGQCAILSSDSGRLAGNGVKIDFLHLIEFAWWSQADQERVWLSLAPCLSPDVEVIIESTPPDNDSGLFHSIWNNADVYGFTRHFYPWWKSPQFVAAPVEKMTMEEETLALTQGLTPEQIGWRRKARNEFMALYGSDKQFKAEFGEAAV